MEMSGKSGSIRSSMVAMATMFAVIAAHGKGFLDWMALGGPAQPVRRSMPGSHTNGGQGRGNVARAKRRAAKLAQARARAPK